MNDTFMKEKPIFPLLTSMALPMVVSMLVNALYNIVDSLFVARISEEAMTALSLVYPVQNLINAIAIGFSIGIAALISLHLGAGNKEKADMAATHGMVLSLLHGVVITVVSIASCRAFCAGSPPTKALWPPASPTPPSCSCLPPSTWPRWPLKDVPGCGPHEGDHGGAGVRLRVQHPAGPRPDLRPGPGARMGIAGAALATGIGQLLNLCVYLFVYLRTELPVRLSRSGLHPDVALDGKLYAIGVPAILNLALPPCWSPSSTACLPGSPRRYCGHSGHLLQAADLFVPARQRHRAGHAPAHRLQLRCQGARPREEAVRAHPVHEHRHHGAGHGHLPAGLRAAHRAVHLQPRYHRRRCQALRIICIGFVVSAVSTTSSGALEGLGKGVPSLVISLCRYVVFIMPLAAVLCGALARTVCGTPSGSLNVWQRSQWKIYDYYAPAVTTEKEST